MNQNSPQIEPVAQMTPQNLYAKAARHNMVESQIRTNKVINPQLIAALSLVERENFVPQQARQVAYIDEDLPIGHGRYLLEGMIFARLVESANISPDDRVLDFGCGCGYASAILAKLANHVQPVDWQADFINQAQENLTKAGVATEKPILINLPKFVAANISNTTQKSQSPSSQIAELQNRDGYDVILVGGAMAEIPQYLLNLLRPNGRLLAIQRQIPHIGSGQAIIIQRIDRAHEFGSKNMREAIFSRTVLFDAATPILPEFMPQPIFQF